MSKHPTKKCPTCEKLCDKRSNSCEKCRNKIFRPIPIEIRFWKKVEKTNDCWLWIAGKYPDGYGVFWNGTTYDGAHRISWELHYGEIPKGMLVCHTCDNPPCVNPEHLWIGTKKDNNNDRTKKGRDGIGYGHTKNHIRVYPGFSTE